MIHWLSRWRLVCLLWTVWTVSKLWMLCWMQILRRWPRESRGSTRTCLAAAGTMGARAPVVADTAAASVRVRAWRSSTAAAAAAAAAVLALAPAACSSSVRPRTPCLQPAIHARRCSIDRWVSLRTRGTVEPSYLDSCLLVLRHCGKHKKASRRPSPPAPAQQRCKDRRDRSDSSSTPSLYTPTR